MLSTATRSLPTRLISQFSSKTSHFYSFVGKFISKTVISSIFCPIKLAFNFSRDCVERQEEKAAEHSVKHLKQKKKILEFIFYIKCLQNFHFCKDIYYNANYKLSNYCNSKNEHRQICFEPSFVLIFFME